MRSRTFLEGRISGLEQGLKTLKFLKYNLDEESHEDVILELNSLISELEFRISELNQILGGEDSEEGNRVYSSS